MGVAEGTWTERLREVIEALNRGDHETAIGYTHPDIEYKRVDGSPQERDVVRGRGALREFLLPDAFESQVVEPLEIFEGEDVVVAHVLVRNRGAGSGLEIEVETYLVYLIEDGLVRRVEAWRGREDSARASGLEL
jgi:ketosteroid isomerase-like protein